MSEISYENFTFQFQDTREVVLLKTEVLEFSPSFYYQNLNNNNKIIFPLGLTPEDFKTFIEVYQKGNLSLNNNNLLYLEEYTNVVKLLKISEFFKNDSFCFVLINNYFITGEKINQQNALTLLEMSYNKLNELNKNGNLEDNNNEEIDNAWFELFLKCLEIVGDNLLYYFQIGKNKENNNDLKSDINLSSFDLKIIDEIVEKFSKYLIKNNVLISENRTYLFTNGDINNITINELESIINYVQNKRGQKNFFDLLTNEYMKICSEDNLNDINNLPNPTFLLKIDVNDIENYYEEFVLDNQIDLKNERKIVLIIFYKKTDDSLNVSIKMESNNKGNVNDNIFHILTFVSSVFIEEIKARQINIKSISNNKSLYSIFKMNNFIKIINSNSNIEYLTLKTFMKPCYFHSILCCFFMNNFSNLYDEPKISKISKHLFLLLLKNKNFLLNNSSDKILKALLNWLDDEINIREDIINIIEYIKWDSVSLDLFLEFILKYGKNISNEELQYIFINSFEKRVENIINFSVNENLSDNIKYFNRTLIKDIINVSKKIDYVNLFYENKKINKLNNFETLSMLVRNNSTTPTNTQSKVNLLANKSINNYNNGSTSNKEQDNLKEEKKSLMSFKDEKKSHISLKSQGNLKGKEQNKLVIKRRRAKQKTIGEKEREIILSESKVNNILGLVEDRKIEEGNNEQKIEIATLKPKSKAKNKISHTNPLMRYMNTTPNQKKNIRKTKSTKNILRKNSNKSFVNVNINTNLNISNNYSIYNFESNNNNQNNQINTNPNVNIHKNNNIVKPKFKPPLLIHSQENKTIKTNHIKQISLLNQISRLKLNNKKDDSSKKINQKNKVKKLNIYDI